VTRDRFVNLVAEVLNSLLSEFRSRIHNLAVLVEDRPRWPQRSQSARPRDICEPRPLLLGIFEGVPSTQKSVFHISIGPDRIVLYQKNIEAVCRSEAEIRHEVRQTVLGHYFGMNADQLDQLKDV